MEDLTQENKTTEEDMASAEDEIANMKKTIEKMEGEQQKKEEVESALMVELDEAKRLIALHHRKGFKKAQC